MGVESRVQASEPLRWTFTLIAEIGGGSGSPQAAAPSCEPGGVGEAVGEGDSDGLGEGLGDGLEVGRLGNPIPVAGAMGEPLADGVGVDSGSGRLGVPSAPQASATEPARATGRILRLTLVPPLDWTRGTSHSARTLSRFQVTRYGPLVSTLPQMSSFVQTV